MTMDAHLSIPTRRIGDAAELLRSRRTPVESLHIRSRDGDTMPRALSRALAEARCLHGIRSVHIEEIDLGREALSALLESSNFAHLENLILDDCDWDSRLGPKLARAIARAKRPELGALALRLTQLGRSGVEVLGHGGLPGLRRLELGACSIGDDGFRALIASPLFAQVTHVALSENGITDAGLDALRTTRRPKSLVALTVFEFGLSARSQQLLDGWAG